jgi:crossover junction endodeoxyribonuclease RuvC
MLAQIIRLAERPCTAMFERVNAMPGQGVTSVFSFGRSSGIVEGVLAALAIPTHIITPQVWQKAASVRGGKDGARQRATELFPAYAGLFARKKDDGRADASCMAWYAATH